jgi:hypothetical protein
MATPGARHGCRISQRSINLISNILFRHRRLPIVPHSPLTPTTMTQPDVPLLRTSLAVPRHGP